MSLIARFCMVSLFQGAGLEGVHCIRYTVLFSPFVYNITIRKLIVK